MFGLRYVLVFFIIKKDVVINDIIEGRIFFCFGKILLSLC